MKPAVVDSSEVVDELLVAIIEKLEKKEFDLPPLPHIASQVLALTSNPDADASRLATLIEQDPVLTARVFQTANSGAYGPQRQIESLQQATAWLGLNCVAGTAFSLSVQTGVFNVRGYECEVKDLWAHAIATGFYGKVIAQRTGHNQDTAFLCGLLHAIGKPFVVHTVNQYRSGSGSPLPWAAITTLMKESAMEVGRQLADAWEFPDPVKEAISLHEDHSYHLATSPTKGAVITCLAKQLASHFLAPDPAHENVLRRLSVVESLKISEDQMSTLLESGESIQALVDTMLI